MSDIVDELRKAKEYCRIGTDKPMEDLLGRAAAEIELLRAELATSETFVATLQEQKYEWDRLTAELAEAKELINWLFDDPFTGLPPEWLPDNWSCGEENGKYFVHHGNDEFVYGETALDAIKNFKAKLAALQEGK